MTDHDHYAKTLFDRLADQRADDWDRQPDDIQDQWRALATDTIVALLRAWAWLTYPTRHGDYATKDALWHCRVNIGKALTALGVSIPDNPRPDPDA